VKEFRQELPYPVEQVFAWHERPGAIHRLMPPWQRTEVLEQSSSLKDGVARLRLPLHRTWVARHLPDEYVAGRQFADRLDSRPFFVPVGWHHQHVFAATAGGTELIDQVETRLPAKFVDPIFRYRHRQLAGDLAAHAFADGCERLTVAVTGASGLVGGALTAFLTTGGHRVISLTRRAPTGPDQRQWDPGAPDPAIFEGVDAVVHLAGHSIAGRFTSEHKQKIRDSRIEPTRKLTLAAHEADVPVFVSASAIGYYGTGRGDQLLDEASEPGEGFLAEVVADWEAAVSAGASESMRVVLVRTGIVQSPTGGALRTQRPLFALGLGGRIGSGKQWQSWIAIDDLVDIFHRALVDERLVGAVNAVAPEPVTQGEYAKTLGRALHRPAILPTPSLGPRLVLGAEGERELISASQHVVPSKLRELGHQFRFDQLEPALRHLFGTA
jgi:uncharacterized protein (TIGR01777 family)